MKKLIILLVALVFLTPAYCQTANEYFSMGLEKAFLEDYRGAMADYTKAIEIDPNYGLTYVTRGLIKHELEDYRGAIADYTKAIEIDPNNASGY
ncbi:tetratricopeptide repeat protein [bacterium]|nr:tetratricopeptide repeat protein [bacterium]